MPISELVRVTQRRCADLEIFYPSTDFLAEIDEDSCMNKNFNSISKWIDSTTVWNEFVNQTAVADAKQSF